MAAVCLVSLVEMASSVNTIVDEAFLSTLDRSKIYNSKSLIEQLESAVRNEVS